MHINNQHNYENRLNGLVYIIPSSTSMNTKNLEYVYYQKSVLCECCTWVFYHCCWVISLWIAKPFLQCRLIDFSPEKACRALCNYKHK